MRSALGAVMKRWPSAFGHEKLISSIRILGISLVAVTGGCAGPVTEESTLSRNAELPLESPYASASTFSDAWPMRAFPQDEFTRPPDEPAAPAYHSESMAATKASYSGLTPMIVTPRKPLQCVPYARVISGIALRGDAHTWWKSAAGRFRRGREPEPGAVLVFKGTDRTPLGHVGVVTKILNEREILIDHANWLNNRKIHLATPVIDVSPENNWSAIRVWYSPGRQYGANVYPTEGFIYSDDPEVFVTITDAKIRQQPTIRSSKIALLPRRSRVEVVGKVPGVPWY
ncbi:MAG: CHAP domain-containing protein, partial [Geminicoccales bacterium]